MGIFSEYFAADLSPDMSADALGIIKRGNVYQNRHHISNVDRYTFPVVTDYYIRDAVKKITYIVKRSLNTGAGVAYCHYKNYS